MLDPDVGILRTAHPNELIELRLQGRAVAVLRILDQETIRKVTTLVIVFTISCQASEKPNSGPLASHTIMERLAAANTEGRPEARATLLASSANLTDISLLHLLNPAALPRHSMRAAAAVPAQFSCRDEGVVRRI